MFSKQSRKINPMEYIVPSSFQFLALSKYCNNIPTMDWTQTNGRFVPPIHDINICFKNNIVINDTASIFIEFPVDIKYSFMSLFPGVIEKISGIGLFFSINSETKEVDMLLRQKLVHGPENLVIFHSLRHFGLDMESYAPRNMSCFTLSNEFQDKSICSYLNFNHPLYEDFRYIVYYINDFIQKNLFENNILSSPPRAYPLLLEYKKQQKKTSWERFIIPRANKIEPVHVRFVNIDQYILPDIEDDYQNDIPIARFV